jgi:fructosamine-3-kinase
MQPNGWTTSTAAFYENDIEWQIHSARNKDNKSKSLNILFSVALDKIT